MTNYEMYKKDLEQNLNIIQGDDFRDQLMAISDISTSILKKTLGPYAHTTIIDDGSFSYPTKDGWSILNKISFGDPVYNTIFNFLKKISFSLVSTVGDGTTTANIVANGFINECNNANLSARQTEILSTLTDIKNKVIERLNSPKYLRTIAKDHKYNDIRKIAYISTNGNDVVSDIIQEIYKKTNNPNIYVDVTPDKETKYELQIGYKFDCKLMAAPAYKNTDIGSWVINEKTRVYIFNHNVTYSEHANIINNIINRANGAGEQVLIFAPYFDDIISDQFMGLIKNLAQQHQMPTCAFIQFGATRKLEQNMRDDFAIVTGTPIITYTNLKTFNELLNKELHPDENDEPDEQQVDLSSNYNIFTSTPELIEAFKGYVTNITFTNGYCIVKDYDDASPEFINNYQEAEATYFKEKEQADKNSTTLTKNFMDASMRFVRLTGKMGAIHVGGESELEKHCTKDAVDDAILACRSAYENGYVAGMNLAVLGAIYETRDELSFESLEYKVADILFSAFVGATVCIFENKYGNSDYKAFDMATEVIGSAVTKKLGYNIITEEFEDYDNLTVINSVSTDVEILNAVVSILSLIMTSNQFLTINKMYDKKLSKITAIQDKKEMIGIIANTLSEIFADKPITHKMILDGISAPKQQSDPFDPTIATPLSL